jgi:hypothetical protein
MKNACIVMTALTVILVSAVWLPSQPASGQPQAARVPEAGSLESFRNLLRYPPAELYHAKVAEFGAHLQAAELVRKYAKTKGDTERGKVKAQLLKALEKEFDLKQKRRRLELEWIDAEVRKAREVLGKRGDERQTIIDRRLQQLLTEADGLGWTGSGRSSRGASRVRFSVGALTELKKLGGQSGGAVTEAEAVHCEEGQRDADAG